MNVETAPKTRIAPWPGAMPDAAFESGQVDLWRIDLDHRARHAWQDIVSPGEVHKAGRLVQKKHRDRFLQGRCWLRTLLSAYSGQAPRELEIGFNRHGKPELPSEYRLGFNLSHCGNLAAIAIGRNLAIGIDIERAVMPDDIRTLAQGICSEQEVESFAALPDKKLLLSFFTCWTRKEAVLKALGTGLLTDPRQIQVGLANDQIRIQLPAPDRAIDVVTMEIDDAAIVSLAVGAGQGTEPIRVRHFNPTPEAGSRP